MLCRRSLDALLTLIVRWNDVNINDFAYKDDHYFDYG
jgi:hypothetical protein